MQGRYFARHPGKFLQSDGIQQNSADFEAEKNPPTCGNRATSSTTDQRAWLAHPPHLSYH